MPCLRFIRSVRSYSTSPGLSNIAATKALKALYPHKNSKLSPSNQKAADSLDKAFQIYGNVNQQKNHFVVNTMLSLCIKLNRPDKVHLFWNDIEQMMKQQRIAYPSLIKWCIKMNDFQRGKAIHKQIPRRDLASPLIQCALVHLYGYFGDFDTAKLLFHSIPHRHRTAVALNTMMTNLSNHGFNAKTISFYHQFPLLHNETSHVLALKACVHSNDSKTGHQIITQNINNSLNNYSNDLLNTLINFYGHFGDVPSAQKVFDHLSSINKLDKITVNSMLKALVKNNAHQNALDLYHKFSTDLQFNLVDDISLISALQSCIKTNSMERGQQIIDRNFNRNLSSNSKLNQHRNPKSTVSIELQTTLITFYGHFGDTQMALNTFNSITAHNAVSINCMMQSFIDNEHYHEALKLYDEYQPIISSNHIAHILALKACIGCNDKDRGESIHFMIGGNSKKSDLNRNVMLCTEFINFYGHFGELNKARNVFDDISNDRRDGICISAMLKCYVNNECNKEALELYDQFERVIKYTESAHLLAIKACTKMEDKKKGIKIIDSYKFDENGSSEMKASVIDFYGHCGQIEDALRVFESIKEDEMEIECINSMMNAYCNTDCNLECIELFEEMESIEKFNGIKRDVISFNTVIKASINGHFIHFGEALYRKLKMEKKEWIERDRSVQVNLINMFSEFGMLSVCEEIFEGATRRELETWNVTLHAFGKSGDLEKVTTLYERMKREGKVNADGTTFTIIINAHSHCGDVESALDIWTNGIGDDYLKYDCFVVTAMVDCFSRSGNLKKAREIIGEYENVRGMEAESRAMWMSLLSACVKFEDYSFANDTFHDFCKRHSGDESYLSAAQTLMHNLKLVDTVKEN